MTANLDQMTRKDYLDGNVTYAEYYTTLAQVAGVSFPPAFLARCAAAYAEGDTNLNTIPLAEWDAMARLDRFNVALVTELRSRGDFLTAAGSVCIRKAEVVRLLESKPTVRKPLRDTTIRVKTPGEWSPYATRAFLDTLANAITQSDTLVEYASLRAWAQQHFEGDLASVVAEEDWSVADDKAIREYLLSEGAVVIEFDGGVLISDY